MRLFLAAALLVAAPAAAAPPPPRAHAPGKPAGGKTEITWLGHSGFRVETPSGKVLLIDPWMQNPKNPEGKKLLENPGKVDLILVTHGHFDHAGDAAALGRKTKAPLVSSFDLGLALVAGGYPKDQAGFETQGNAGGTLDLLGGDVQVTLTPAIHSSEVTANDKGTYASLVPAGNAGGFLIRIKNGPTLYHAGDTDLFSEMATLGKVDVMMVPIGDHFTMGPERAAQAVKLVGPKTVIPMHYGTFPVLTGTPDAFRDAVKKSGSKADVMVLEVNKPVQL